MLWGWERARFSERWSGCGDRNRERGEMGVGELRKTQGKQGQRERLGTGKKEEEENES